MYIFIALCMTLTVSHTLQVYMKNMCIASRRSN